MGNHPIKNNNIIHPERRHSISVKCSKCKKITQMVADISGIPAEQHHLLYRQFSENIAKDNPEATILYTDIKDFTKFSANNSPKVVFDLLSHFNMSIDSLKSKYNITKVETIGDCYIAVAFKEDNPNHADDMINLGRKILTKVMPEIRNEHYWYEKDKNSNKQIKTYWDDFTCRVGIATGNVISGWIRCERAKWQLVGKTMNYASRMESTCPPGMMQISKETYQASCKNLPFQKIKIKVKGISTECETYIFQPKIHAKLGTKIHPDIRNLSSESTLSPLNKKNALVIGETITVGMQVKKELEKSGFNARLSSMKKFNKIKDINNYDLVTVNVDNLDESIHQLENLKLDRLTRRLSKSKTKVLGTRHEKPSPKTAKKMYQAGVDKVFVKSDGSKVLQEYLLKEIII